MRPPATAKDKSRDPPRVSSSVRPLATTPTISVGGSCRPPSQSFFPIMGMRKVTIRQSLVDDGHTGRVLDVGGTEVPPIQNGQPQKLEVVQRHGPHGHRNAVALLGGGGLPSMSTVAGQLVPVSGTPHVKAAYCTPGSADTRPKAR